MLGMGFMPPPRDASTTGTTVSVVPPPWRNGWRECVCVWGGGMDGVCGYRVPSHSKVKPGQTGLELDG